MAKRPARMVGAAVAAAVVLVAGGGVAVATADGTGWGMAGRHVPGHPMMDGSGRPGGGGMPGMPGGQLHPWLSGELDYLTSMIPHHQEAIVAAGELARSERREMRELGAAIVASQTAQVAQMEAWLEEWYPGETADADYEPMMRDLSGLEGDALDRAFLRDMVAHHRMAVMMSQQLLRHGLAEHDDVAALAADIRDEQRAEIRQMSRWYAAWFGGRSGGWPGGPCPGGGAGHMGPMGHMGQMGQMGGGMGPGWRA